MEKGLKLLCRKCAAREGFISGLAFSGTLSIDDGFDCPVCREEDEGKIIGEEIGIAGKTERDESGGRR